MIKSGWGKARLGEVVKFIGGSQPPKSSFIGEERDGYIRLLQIRDYKTNSYKTYIPSDQARRFCSKDDIMIGRYGPPIFQILRGLEGAYNVALLKAEPSPKVTKDYLYYFLKQRTLFNFIERLSQRTAGQSGVDMDGLKNYPILVPPLSQQKLISAILNKADAIRRKRQQAIKLADDFLRAIFLDMFGDPVTNPKKWDRVTLADLIKVKSGNFLPSKLMGNGPYAVYGGNGINGSHNEYMFEKPMIVIGRVGVYCGAIHKTRPRSWITDNALYVAEKSDAIIDSYLEWVLHMANLNQYASQAGQPLISGSRIYPVEINVPPKEIQLNFEKIQALFIRSKEKLSSDLRNAETLFNSLTQRAFRGEL